MIDEVQRRDIGTGLVTEVTSSHETCFYSNKRPNHFAAKLEFPFSRYCEPLIYSGQCFCQKLIFCFPSHKEKNRILNG